MTPRETAIKRIIAAGGVWPPSARTMAKMALTPWAGTGRHEPLLCRGCGGPCDASRRWCSHCAEVQP